MVLVQPVEVRVKVNVAVPAATACTSPAFVTVATPGLLLTHVPPLVGDNIVVVLPIQIELVLKFTAGCVAVTEPLILLETQFKALFRTVIVKGIEPADAGEVRVTLITPPDKVPLVTVVIPVPDILY